LENSYKKYTSDIIAIGLANVLTSLTGIVFLPLVTKILGVHSYGIWVQFQTLTVLISSFIVLGLPTAMNRFLAVEKDLKVIRDDVWSVTLCVIPVALAVSVIMFIFARSIAHFFFDDYTNVVQASSVFVFVYSFSSIFLNYFRTFRQMVKYAVLNTVSTYTIVIIIVFLVLKGYGVFSLVIVDLIVSAVLCVVSFLLVARQIGLFSPRFTRIKSYLIFGLPTIPAATASWVVDSSDKFFIGHFLGATSVGIYAAADSIGSIPIILGFALSLILPQTLSKLYDENRIQELKTHLKYTLKYSLVLLIPFVFGSIALAIPIIKLFSTAVAAYQGQTVLIFMSVNSLVLVTGMILTQILIPANKTKIIGISWTIAAIINFSLNLILVPHVGIVGAAISTLVAYLVDGILELYFSLKEIKFEIDWQSVIKCFIASIIMSLCLWKISPGSSIATLLTVILGMFIYGIMLFVLKVFKPYEFNFFKRQLLNILHK
jgi:O-antigen/teichoic acid export membrane protein